MKIWLAIAVSPLILCAADPVELPAGAELNIRLTQSVSTSRNREGDPLRAVLIAPVSLGGRQLLPAGLEVDGLVSRMEKRSLPGKRPLMSLSFNSVRQADQTIANLDARLASVDNVREKVSEDGVIRGRSPARARPTKAELVIYAATYAHPAVIASAQLTRVVLTRIFKPQIHFPSGIEMTLRLLRPASLRSTPAPAISRLNPGPAPQELHQIAQILPEQTRDRNSGDAVDVTNLLFAGTGEQIRKSFEQAGWQTADKLCARTRVKTFFAFIFFKPYQRAPVSPQTLAGALPELVFQKQGNTTSMRHHLRIWSTGREWNGKPVWVAAATHDVGIVWFQDGRICNHKIDPLIDREREKVIHDLSFTGKVGSLSFIERPMAAWRAENIGPRPLATDGRMAVLELN